MANQITLLDHAKHGDLKITSTDFAHVAEQHIVPISLHEIARAVTEYPVVFVKNAESGEFQSVVMLGLKPGQNLSVKDGNWQGLYVPAVVRDYPLGLVLNPEIKDKVWIGIREEAKEVSKEEGAALFDGEKETPFLDGRKKALIEHFEQDQATRSILGFLAEKELLKSQSITVEIAGEKRNINGLYIVDEEKLNGLSDEDYLALRQRGLLAPIFAHLASMNQINRLARAETQG
ncbi:SapC family protein [Shewanella intestini]|uniref:SapC family protein n=1 Tax=Shewanella intestini TaxID=2017544 RepID=A0ABS5HZ57_9GAMM|nr:MULTISPECIES: SapC family protein [Shewanella]MBR9726704.1 SapC family protein [Shewanella intestini]MRG34730.1 multidrug transporter [Shewanella sp. XMDDZSB0408]